MSKEFKNNYPELSECLTKWYEEWTSEYDFPEPFVKEYIKGYVVTMTPSGFVVNFEEIGTMNQYDVAGILRTYSEKCSKCDNTTKLKEIIKELKQQLDLRMIKVDRMEK